MSAAQRQRSLELLSRGKANSPANSAPDSRRDRQSSRQRQ